MQVCLKAEKSTLYVKNSACVSRVQTDCKSTVYVKNNANVSGVQTDCAFHITLLTALKHLKMRLTLYYNTAACMGSRRSHTSIAFSPYALPHVKLSSLHLEKLT